MPTHAAKSKLTALTTIALLSSGCTTRLEATRLGPDHPPGNPVNGIIYYLPQGVIDVVITRTLQACDGRKMAFNVSAESSVAHEPDFSHPLLIDYEDLNNWMKKTTLKVGLYDDGTLKSLDGDLADRSAQAAGNVGKAVVNVAKIALEAIAPGGPAEKPTEQICNCETLTKLQARKETKAKIEALTADLVTSPDDKRKAIETKIDDAKRYLAILNNFLTTSDTYSKMLPSFSKDGDIWEKQLDPTEDVAMRWLQPRTDAPKKCPQIKQPVSFSGKYFAAASMQMQEMLQVTMKSSPSVQMKKPDAAKNDDGKSQEAARTTAKGPVFYRQPGPMQLSFIRYIPENPENPISDWNRKPVTFGETVHLIPQLSIEAQLPLVNRWLDSNVIKATFQPSGGLSSFEYVTEAQLEAATSILATATDSGLQITQEATSVDTTKLQNRVSELKLENELIELRQKQDELRN